MLAWVWNWNGYPLLLPRHDLIGQGVPNGIPVTHEIIVDRHHGTTPPHIVERVQFLDHSALALKARCFSI
jgi:hypothetical protein